MYVLRRAHVEDAPEIQKINHRNLPEKYSLGFITRILQRPGAHYVVEHRNKIVGYVLAPINEIERLKFLRVRGSIGHVVSIAVEPEHRRKGLARRMMEKVIEDMRGLVEFIMLEVRVSNEPAIRLYTSLGFSISYVRPGYYRDGETGLVMTYRYGRETFNRSSVAMIHG